MAIELLDNPRTIDAKAVGKLVARGDRPTLNFSRRPPDALLRKVNALCAKHGDALEVRFYGDGFGTAGFDGRILAKVPAVSALLIDCLSDMTHLEELGKLTRLRSLSLGVERLDASAILAMPSLRRLRYLRVDATKKAIDLSPVSTMKELTELSVSGQETSIDTIGQCAGLRSLTLRMIRRDVRLGFVARLGKLRSLRLALGGRDDIDELAHPNLTKLSVVRVRGLARIGPEIFPRLERLEIEDELQLRELGLGRNPKLRYLMVANCKNLRRLGGLRRLSSLRELRIVQTPLALDDLLADGLPRSLRTLVIYTGAARRDTAIRERLDALGFTE